tara:strand:- start:4918 stop:5151 length:234 start_codon:yes stop_codon:yes gene_type:complete
MRQLTVAAGQPDVVIVHHGHPFPASLRNLPPQKLLLSPRIVRKTKGKIREGSFRYSSAQDLCPEEATLCSLDDLLVD